MVSLLHKHQTSTEAANSVPSCQLNSVSVNVPHLPLLKKRQQAQNGVISTKLTSRNRDLIPHLGTVPTSPGSGIFHKSVWNYQVSTSEAMGLRDKCYLKKVTFATNNPHLLATSFCASFCPLSFILYSSPELLSICRMGCCLIQDLLNKANKIFTTFS